MADRDWRSAARAPVGFVILLLLIPTALSLAGSVSWFCDLFTHFRPELTLGLALGTVLALVVRHRRLQLLSLAGLLANVICLAQVVWVSPAAVVTVPDGRAARVVSFNVAFFNRRFREIAPWLETQQPDVIAIQELPARELPAVLAQLHHYPYQFLDANIGNYGVVIVSRWPLANGRVVDLGVPERNAAQVTVQLPGAPFTVTAVHLLWPLTPESSSQRNQQMKALAPALASCRGPCVAVGDFNATRWTPHFQDLVRDSGMRDCARGLFVPQTWPSWPIPLRIRIDQCLVNQDVEVMTVAAGPDLGSDHLPTINDLSIARPRS